jgi:hypothetical protein
MKYVTNCSFFNAMYVHKQHKIGWLVVCRYRCQYGPKDFTNVVKDNTQNHNVVPKKLNINGKVIPSRMGHKGTQNSRKKWGGYIKRGCRIEFRHCICSNMY